MFTLILSYIGMAAFGPIGAFIGAQVGQQLDARFFGPVVGQLNDRHVTGASLGTTYQVWFIRWRVDTIIVQAEERENYARHGPAKYKVAMTCLAGRCPQVNPGDGFICIIEKLWLSGYLWFDNGVAPHSDPPSFLLGGNQTKADPGMLSIDPDSTAMQGHIVFGWARPHRLHLPKFGNGQPQQMSALCAAPNADTGNLRMVLDAMAAELNIPSAFYDFSEVEGVACRGCSYQGNGDVDDWAQKVCEILRCTLYKAGGKQRAKPLTAATADHVLDWTDMGVVEWAGQGEPSQLGRLREITRNRRGLPFQVLVNYRNVDNDDLAGMVPCTFDHSPGLKVENFDATFMRFTAIEAQEFGYYWLDDQDKKLRQYVFSCGIVNADIMVGQVVDIPLDEDGTRRMLVMVDKIDDREILGPSLYYCHRVSDGTYTPSTPPSGGGGGVSGGTNKLGLVTARVFSGVVANPNDPAMWHPNYQVAATWAPDVNSEGSQVRHMKLGGTVWNVISPNGGDEEDDTPAITARTPIGNITAACPWPPRAGITSLVPRP
jgi:hypothetical protein